MMPCEERTFKQTKLRNLRRQYARVTQHADLTEMALELKSEIDNLEQELGL